MNYLNRLLTTFVATGVLLGCATHPRNQSLEDRILTLVDQAAGEGGSAKRAFLEMESIGDQAVPYLVGHLGDMRPLRVDSITLNNKATDAFEQARIYKPKTVHDGLAAVLNQLTGQHFVFVYNGATQAERQENKRRWSDWCHLKYPAQAGICGEK